MNDKCISHMLNLPLNTHLVKGLRCRRMRLETHGYMYFQSRYKDLEIKFKIITTVNAFLVFQLIKKNRGDWFHCMCAS